MNLQGCTMAKLKCVNCRTQSALFRITLAWDSEDGNIWLEPKFPTGWLVDEDAELNSYDDMGNLTDLVDAVERIIFAYCPKCKIGEVSDEQN